MSICGLRRLSIHYTPHPRAVLPLCFSASAATYTTPEEGKMFIHARMGSMSSILATVSTALRRAQHEPRRRRSPYRPRRSRLFPARVTSLFFRFRRPVPLPPFPPAAPPAPLPKGRRHRPRFPVLFSLLSNSFSELYFAIFSVPNAVFSDLFLFQALRAPQTGARNKKKHARAACFLRFVF